MSRRIVVNYRNGIDNPEFHKRCYLCRKMVGPFFSLAKVQEFGMCEACQDKQVEYFRERLKESRE